MNPMSAPVASAHRVRNQVSDGRFLRANGFPTAVEGGRNRSELDIKLLSELGFVFRNGGRQLGMGVDKHRVHDAVLGTPNEFLVVAVHDLFHADVDYGHPVGLFSGFRVKHLSVVAHFLDMVVAAEQQVDRALPP